MLEKEDGSFVRRIKAIICSYQLKLSDVTLLSLSVTKHILEPREKTLDWCVLLIHMLCQEKKNKSEIL